MVLEGEASVREQRMQDKFKDPMSIGCLLAKWTLEHDLMSYLQEHPLSLLNRLRCTSQRKVEMTAR